MQRAVFAPFYNGVKLAGGGGVFHSGVYYFEVCGVLSFILSTAGGLLGFFVLFEGGGFAALGGLLFCFIYC